MGTTRDAKGKLLKASMKGADYGAKAAGAATIGLEAFTLCGLVLSNPIILAIAGGACALFCCLGCYTECRKPAPEDKEAERDKTLAKLSNDIGEIKQEIKQDSAAHGRNISRTHTVPGVGVFTVNDMSMFAKRPVGSPPRTMMEPESKREGLRVRGG